MTDGVPSAVPSSPLAAPLTESPSVASQRGEAMREIGSFGAAAPADLGVLPRGAAWPGRRRASGARPSSA